MAAFIDPRVKETAERYAAKLRSSGIRYEAIYLFGSLARGEGGEGSDIDIAVFARGVDNRFQQELHLMKLRRGIDLRIEPHLIDIDELDSPFGRNIVESGLRVQ